VDIAVGTLALPQQPSKEAAAVEVKIGVQHTPREIVFESAQNPAEVEQMVAEALQDPKGVLRLVDDKGRRIIVQAGIIAYVEIAETELRRVGFVAGA